MNAYLSHATRDPEADQGRAPLIEVLGRMADELALLAGHMAQTDALLDQLLTEVGASNFAALQQVDRLRQETEGLHQFVAALALTLQPDGTCDPVQASSVLRLRAQVLRLQGKAAETASNDIW